ncbi:MAG TPA: hypothetical protein VFQ76_20995 [Longimicrobiaceae bacterium]|nr:hypothetical protein [Longimicrobiaceae bacterium]
MKAAAALLLLPLLAVPARAVEAQDHGTRISVSTGSDDDSPGRLAPRRHPRDARAAIATRAGKVALLLTRDAVAMQLTERGLRDIGRDMDEDMDEEDGFLAGVIQAAVRSSVTTMLKRSVEYPVSELRDVDYRGGRLVFTGEDGERVFENVTVNDTDVMESFSDADARAFVREFRRLKAATR